MARIKEEDIDLLREKADLVEVVSSYTPLKKASGSTFKGLCPFHSEKTPSFTVDTGKSLFHCFGCSRGGNIYQFVQEIESLPFGEAVEWVARRFGYELRYEDQRPGEAQTQGLKRRILEANREAAEFFYKALLNSPDAEPARRYLKSRGFGREVAERWKLGWAPGRDSLWKELQTKGFKQDELVQADLVRVSERDGSIYDSFRQRIIFPTWGLQDDVVAFGARAMADQQPKYLNTSETPVFSKSRFMYGLNRAKSSLGRGNDAVIVEGYTDVIALHEAGIVEAIATNGTALGESHFELLKRFTSRAVLMFDADEAGKGAADKGFPALKQRVMEVFIARLPMGRDPAEIVEHDGAEGIRKMLEDKQPLWEFVLERAISQGPLDTPEARSSGVKRAIEVLGWHPDPIARHEYVFTAARLIGVEPDVVQRELAERAPRGKVVTGGTAGSDAERRLPGHVKVEREALQLLLTRAADVASNAADVQESDFTSPARRELFARALDAAKSGGPSGAEIAGVLSPDALTLFTELSVGDVDLDGEPLAQRARELFVRLRLFTLERELKGRRGSLEQLNPLQEPEQHDALFTELVGLEAQRRDLRKVIQGENPDV
jgi:DNA primase